MVVQVNEKLLRRRVEFLGEGHDDMIDTMVDLGVLSDQSEGERGKGCGDGREDEENEEDGGGAGRGQGRGGR